MFFSEVFRKLSKQNIAFIIWNKHQISSVVSKVMWRALRQEFLVST